MNLFSFLVIRIKLYLAINLIYNFFYIKKINKRQDIIILTHVLIFLLYTRMYNKNKANLIRFFTFLIELNE